jgi:hypothetical protein
MSQIVVDADVQKQIEEATGPIKIVTQSGSTIGMVTPIKFPQSPYSREEIERRRAEMRQHGGRTTAEVLARLREREQSQ